MEIPKETWRKLEKRNGLVKKDHEKIDEIEQELGCLYELDRRSKSISIEPGTHAYAQSTLTISTSFSIVCRETYRAFVVHREEKGGERVPMER